MGQVVRVDMGSKRVQKPAKLARKRRRKPVPKSLDPRRDMDNRTFEFTLTQTEGAEQFARRVRITMLAKGGLVNNIRKMHATGDEYIVGMVSEEIGHNKWSPATYGGIPTIGMIAMVREVVETAKPLASVKSPT
jgi:hypothetical protein